MANKFYIYIKRAQRAKLRTRGYSNPAISDALTYRRSSIVSHRIRNEALNLFGGILMIVDDND